MINKGHLTALDDPQVRQEAAKYGDPDKLLQENRIPAIPESTCQETIAEIMLAARRHESART